MRVISGEGAFARLVEEMRWLERGARDGAPWPLVPLPRRTAGGAPRACHYRPVVGLVVVPACFCDEGGAEGAAEEAGAPLGGAGGPLGGAGGGGGAPPFVPVPGPVARATATAAALAAALRRALAGADAAEGGAEGGAPRPPRVVAASPSALFLAPPRKEKGAARSVYASDAPDPPRAVAKGAEFTWVVVGGPVFFGWKKNFGCPDVVNASIAGLVYDPHGLWAWPRAGLPPLAPDGVPAPDWPEAGCFAQGEGWGEAGPEALADAAALRGLVVPGGPHGPGGPPRPAFEFRDRPLLGYEFALRVDEGGRAALRGATRRRPAPFPKDTPPPSDPPEVAPGARCGACGRRLVGAAYRPPAGARPPPEGGAPPLGFGAEAPFFLGTFRCVDCAEGAPRGCAGGRVAAPSAAEACAGEHPRLAALHGAPAETLAPGLAWRVNRVLVTAPALGAWPTLTCRAARDALASGAAEAVVTGLSLA